MNRVVMSSNLRVCCVINEPVASVWNAIVDIKTHVKWMAEAKSIRFTSASQSGIGTAFECVTKLGPIRLIDRMSVTDWQPGETMAIDHFGAVKGSGRFTLHELKPNQTRFCWEEELTFPWWLGGPIGGRMAQPILMRVWRGNLARLKQRTEESES